MQEKILILDFGSQYTQLIARRVRELNVYCEIHPFNKIPAIDASVRGVILSGSPSSVRDAQTPIPDLSAIKGRLPLLGVCYGAQYLAHAYGGEVEPAPSREYGRAMLTVADAQDPLMAGLSVAHAGVDVARRHHYARARQLPHRRQHGGCARSGLPHRWRADVGHPVPPRSLPLDRRYAAAPQLRRGHLRLLAVVDLGELRRVDRARVAREARQRQGGAGPFGRCRLVGGRRAAAPRHRAEPLLHLRRFGPAAQERVRGGARLL